MQRVTRQSRKEELWTELEKLRLGSEAQRQQLAALEREAQQLREEVSRLEQRTKMAEEGSERVRAAHEKLEILTSLTKELASFDTDGVLRVAVQRIPYLVGARFASVYLFDQVSQRLLLKHHTHDRKIDQVVDLRAAPQSLMAVAVRTRKTLCIDDLVRWSAPDGESVIRPHQGRYATSSCIVAPLVAGGDVHGVLNLADRFDHRPFDPEQQLALIRQARDLVAVSLRNARMFEEIQRAARTCSLTGLKNHQAFVEDLEKAVRRAEQERSALSLVVVNLRGLRLFNANHGHQAGDAVLIQAAHVLQQHAPEPDLTGRIGGSEFGLVLPGMTKDDASRVAERLGRLITETRFMIGSDTTTIQAALAVAGFKGAGCGADLLREALESIDRARRAARADRGLVLATPPGPQTQQQQPPP